MERHAAQAALGYIRDHMTIGLGTGKAVDYLIEFISMEDYPGLKIVAPSIATARKCMERGLNLVPSSMVTSLDFTFDTLDFVFDDLSGSKKDVSAGLQDQLLAAMSGQFVFMADRSSLNTVVTDSYPIQVEVCRDAYSFVSAKLTEMGGNVITNQSGKGSPDASVNGNYVLNVSFRNVKSAADLSDAICDLPGVIATSVLSTPNTIALIYDGNGVETRKAE